MAREGVDLLEMGARIRELRQQHGFKQQWIADQIGVTLRTYQFWQQGKSPPEQENLEKLARLFDVEPTYILNGTPAPVEAASGAQLDRIERKIDLLIRQLLGPDRSDLAEEIERELDEAVGQADSPSHSSDAGGESHRGEGWAR